MALISTLVDDFNGGSINTSLWDVWLYSFADASVSSGDLVLTTWGGSESQGTLTSDIAYEMENTTHVFKMESHWQYLYYYILKSTAYPPTTASPDVYLEFTDTGGTKTLKLFVATSGGGGVQQFSYTMPDWNRYIKMAFSGTTLTISQSADGFNWTTAGSSNLSTYSISMTGRTSKVQFYWARPDDDPLVIINSFGILPSIVPGPMEGDSIVTASGIGQYVGSGDIVADSELTASGTLFGYGSANLEGDSTVISDRITMEGDSIMVPVGDINPLTITKTYLYKIYDKNWNFIGVWNDVVSDFSYSQEINSAGSAISVTLARNSDSVQANYDVLADDSSSPIVTDDNTEITAELSTTSALGPGTTVDLNLNVKIYEFSSGTEAVEGDLVFTGYISMYTSQYGSTENTVVSIFSYGADLDNYILMDGNNTRVPYYSTDPSMIMRSTLDKFNADGGIVSYFHNDTALALSGTAGQHAVSNADFTLGLTNANIFTFACWIKPTTLPNLANRMAIWSGNNVASTFILEVGGSVTGDTGTVLALVNGTEVAKTANNQIAAGNWYHIVYVKNGTGAGASTIYINGSSVSTPVNVAFTYADTIATHFIGGRTDTSQKFNGIIDDVTIWDSALNSTQVAALYNTNTRVANPKLWYKLDENNGYVINNSGSKTGATMTLAGGYFTDTIPPPMQAAITEENTITNTNTTVSYTFNANTELEVLKKSLELAPTDWFFYADLATNLLHVHPRPTTPAHYFYLGKHVLGLSLEKTMEGIVNDVLFTGGTPTNLVLDTMTMPAGTNLLNHLPEVGSTWVQHSTTVASQSILANSIGGVYKSTTGETFIYNNVPMPGTDFDVSIDIYVYSAAGEMGIMAGLAPTGTDNGILAQVGGTGGLSLYSRTTGTWTQIGAAGVTVTPTIGGTHTMRLAREGQNIKMYWDGSAKIEYTGTASTTAGTNVYTGVRSALASTATTGYHLMKFTAKLVDPDLVQPIYKRYIDATSISTYRRGVEKITDNRVTLESSADIIVSSRINRFKNPRYRSNITISGSTYDIKSIKLGDLVGFRNFDNFVDTVTMQIVRIDYKGDSVSLQLDTLLPTVPKRLEDINRNLTQAENSNNPDAPS